MNTKERQIRAVFDEHTITVYQAYKKEIAHPAVKHQKFVAPFKMDRMTWIKPSFLWMMYRCGWGQKEGQEHILAIQIKKAGFLWALEHACLSHYDATIHQSHDEWKAKLSKSPVRIQWDPERDIDLEKLDYRSIQIGLSGIAVSMYVKDWIISIKDISPLCHKIYKLLPANREEALKLLPKEEVFSI